MSMYARVYEGRVVELFNTDMDISTLFHPDLIWAECPDGLDVEQGWVADKDSSGSWVLTPYIAPSPSEDEVISKNTSQRNALLTYATLLISPLQDAVDLGWATDAERASLSIWKEYRVAVNRIDLTDMSPAWPASPESL